MYTYMYLQIVLDSIAALARKEGLNEVDKEQFIIGQVSIIIMCSMTRYFNRSRRYDLDG